MTATDRSAVPVNVDAFVPHRDACAAPTLEGRLSSSRKSTPEWGVGPKVGPGDPKCRQCWLRRPRLATLRGGPHRRRAEEPGPSMASSRYERLAPLGSTDETALQAIR